MKIDAHQHALNSILNHLIFKWENISHLSRAIPMKSNVKSLLVVPTLKVNLALVSLTLLLIVFKKFLVFLNKAKFIN